MNIHSIHSNDQLRLVAPIVAHTYQCGPKDHEVLVRRWAEAYERGGAPYTLIAFQGENMQPLGIISCSTRVHLDGIHVIVEDLAVHPVHQNQHIATSLVRTVEESAKRNGVKQIDYLVYDPKNFAFWGKLGYEQLSIGISKSLR